MKLPSDYKKTHDWDELTDDYQNATILNEIDQKIEEAKYKAMSGTK